MPVLLTACLLKVTATGFAILTLHRLPLITLDRLPLITLDRLPLLIALLHRVRLSFSPLWYCWFDLLVHYSPSLLNVWLGFRRSNSRFPAQRPIYLGDDDNRDFFAHDHLAQLDRILRNLGFNVICVHDFKVTPASTTSGEIYELSVGKHCSSELITGVYLIISHSIFE